MALRAEQAAFGDSPRTRHTKFDLGMIRDIQSCFLPEGACYDAQDMLCDMPGRIRKRGGTTSPSSSNRTATVENLLSFRSNGVDGVSGLFGSTGKTAGAVYTLDRTTGAMTSLIGLGGAAVIVARPFQHFNYGVFPYTPAAQATTAGNGIAYAGGGTGASFAITNSTVTAGNNRITAVAPTSFVAGHLGCIITILGVANVYIGRIVEVTSSSAVRVEPTPVYSIPAGTNTGNVIAVREAAFFGSKSDVGGRYGVSFQNRIVLGYTSTAPSASISNGLGPEPNRIRWTNLTTDAVPAATYAPPMQYDGDTFLYVGPFLGDTTTPYYNYQDIPNLEGMTGLAAIGDGQLLIFGPRKMFRLSGQLTTNTAQNNTLAYSVDQISNNVGIPRKTTQGIDDPSKSIQYASGGLIFASSNDIFLYDGSSLKPLLQGRNARWYQGRLRNGDLIYGSGYSPVTNHYYLSMSGSDGGILIDLDNLSQTRMTGPTTQLFDCVPDPDNASKLWGPRWWDTTGAAPTMTKGQLIQIDPIWAPTSANQNDADGTALRSNWRGPAWVNGPISATKTTTDVVATVDIRGSGSPTATLGADSKLNVADASYTTIGTLASGTTSPSKGFPVGYQIADGPAIEFQVLQAAAADSLEIVSFDVGTQSHPEQFGAS